MPRVAEAVLTIGETGDGEPFTLPVQAATVTATIVARRGAGKTNTAGVHVEEMVRATVQVVVLDPVGVWWGLRASADGEAPGLPVTVLGGEHGDLPLEPDAGVLVADLVVEEGISAVLDLSGFDTEADKRRFVESFVDRLYRRKATEEYRTPLHVVLEEAEEFAPQQPQAGEQRMLGAVTRLVKRGRSRGLAATLITQRPASLNKNVMSQSEMLVILAITSPHDRRAVDEWIRAYGDEEQRAEVLGSVATLPVGAAFYWWPTQGVFERAQVRRRDTFDASFTPRPGEIRRNPRALADVDLEALREKLAAAVERAEQEDPKALRRRIAELERELSRRPQAELRVERVEVPVLAADQVQVLQDAATAMAELGDPIARVATSLANSGRELLEALHRVEAARAGGGAVVPLRRSLTSVPANETPVSSRQQSESERSASIDSAGGEVRLKAGARRMLQALAAHRQRELTRQQLATLTRMSAKGGTFQTYLGTLKRNGLVEEAGGHLGITPAGVAYLGNDVPPGPEGTAELMSTWGEVLKAGARRMLEILVESYPRSLTREDLAARVEMEPSGGTFQTYLGTLRRNGLVDVDGGHIRASEALFLDRAKPVK